MKIQSFLTVAAIAVSLALPACMYHDAAVNDIQTDRKVISGDPATGNYVEEVTERGPNYSKTTSVTHSIATKQVDPATVKNPNATTHTVKETNVRRVMTPEGIKENKTATESHSVTPNE
ncbi:MAG: hypothetical protein JWM96_669 [Alphaproteobacteria bacterium]|nr:hypothetical protein [Alphaproteobacteria bacterium]